MPTADNLTTMSRFVAAMRELLESESCEGCSIGLTCAHLNREDTLERREDDDTLCWIIMQAIAEWENHQP